MAAKAGLLPREFWRLTPAEFLLYLDGWQWREDQRWYRTAWQTAWIINHWRPEANQLTIGDLLPKHEAEKKREPMTDEQMAENMLAWALIMGAEDKRGQKGAV
ncbi:MAG: hypothetical protein WDA72_11050 [Desulfomonilia bacterium]|nr:phage tail assembly chaperone [Clostridiales bacterium]